MEKIKMKFKIFLLSIMFIFLTFVLTGCTNENKDFLDDKIESELKYLETNIYNIAYKYATREYEENILNDNVIANIINLNEENGVALDVSSLEINLINFDKVKDDVKKVNNSLDVLMIDLSEKNIEANSILSLSQNINNLIINTSEENINIVLRDINEIEKNIVSNYNNLAISDSKKKIRTLKSNILDVFVSSIIYEEKNISKDAVNILLENFRNDLNNQEFVNDNAYLINNVYVLLQEFKSAVDLENEELIKVKYLALIDIL